VSWTDVLLYGPGWLACAILPVTTYFEWKWAKEERGRR
jgi:hypothetical protein